MPYKDAMIVYIYMRVFPAAYTYMYLKLGTCRLIIIIITVFLLKIRHENNYIALALPNF